MKDNKTRYLTRRPVSLFGSILLAGVLAACSGGGNGSGSNSGEILDLDMQIPNSLTGGPATSAVVAPATIRAVTSGAADLPCAYQGPDDEDDPFRNGYEMTKFMVSAVAAWTCWADTLIEIAAYVPHDGQITATENQTDVDNYDADEPTHYSVTDDSATQTTARLYYGYDRDVPPLVDADPQFFLSWNKDENGDIQGRLIIDASGIDAANRNPEDPITMRMDFQFSGTEKIVDMFLRFDDGNPWADGFRIEVSKDLTAAPFAQVFTARGMINSKRQFIQVPGISEYPELQMYTVSDASGNGAAIADLRSVALPLVLNAASGNHLGNYLFDKVDGYFFDADQSTSEPWDWIYKTFTAAQYRGGRTTPVTGGTLFPVFDPSLDQIITELNLPNSYFSGNECASIGDDCVQLLNAIFADGFAGQEPNQGFDPQDWRSAALQSPVYLDSVYPNGSDWNGAFDFSFTPAP